MRKFTAACAVGNSSSAWPSVTVAGVRKRLFDLIGRFLSVLICQFTHISELTRIAGIYLRCKVFHQFDKLYLQHFYYCIVVLEKRGRNSKDCKLKILFSTLRLFIRSARYDLFLANLTYFHFYLEFCFTIVHIVGEKSGEYYTFYSTVAYIFLI